MKTRTRIPAKVVTKPPQKTIQTTLERHSISRDVSEKFKTKTVNSNSGLSFHKLSNISLLPKQKTTTIPRISDQAKPARSAPWLNQDCLTAQTINLKPQPHVIENISSSPQQIQGGFWNKVKKGVSNIGKSIGGAVGGVTDFFTQQFNSGKGDADRILKNAEREANRVIQAGEAEAKRIMGDGSISSSRAKGSGGISGKIQAAIGSFKISRIFAKLENNAITPTNRPLIQGFLGKILQKIKSVVSGASPRKISFNSGGKYNARGRAKAVAEVAKRKARRVAALARLRAKKFLRQRERIAKHLVNSAKTQAERINQDAKSRSQRMMERGEYTAARSLLYKEKKRARLLIHRNQKYAQNILDKAQTVANRIIAKGKLKAERIIELGEKKADFIIQDGKKRADNVIREAQQRAEQIKEQGKRDADKAIRQQRKNVFQKLAGWIGDGIGSLANAVGNIIKAAGNFIGKVVQGAANFLKAVGEGIQKLGQAIADGAAKAWNNVKKAVKKAAEAVKEFVKEAVKIVKEIAQIIVDVISGPFKILRQLKAIIDRIGGKIKTIWTKITKNPLKFGETLINGGKAGFKKFANGFLGHLENGIQSFLFGQTKLKFPSFSIQGIIQWLLQAVGLSGKQVRQMAVDKLGEDKVVFAEGLSEAASEGKVEGFAEDQLNTYKDNVLGQASGEVNSYKDKAVGKASKTLGVPSNKLNILVQLLTAVRKGGEGIVNFFKELNLKDMVKEMVFEGIKDYLMETIKERAIPFAMAKLAASTTPIVGWIMAAIDALKMAHTVFIQYANKVEALIDSVGESLVNAANHVETGVATKLEEGMGRAISVLMAALASYANINNIPAKIQGIVKKAQDWVNSNIKPPINKIIETVGSFIPDLSGKQLVNSVKQGFSSVVGGVGDIYFQLRNYLTGVTNKTFDSKEQAETEINQATSSFKLQGINSIELEPANNTGHIYDVIAMKHLPGRKPVIARNSNFISRKSNVLSQVHLQVRPAILENKMSQISNNHRIQRTSKVKNSSFSINKINPITQIPSLLQRKNNGKNVGQATIGKRPSNNIKAKVIITNRTGQTVDYKVARYNLKEQRGFYQEISLPSNKRQTISFRSQDIQTKGKNKGKVGIYLHGLSWWSASKETLALSFDLTTGDASVPLLGLDRKSTANYATTQKRLLKNQLNNLLSQKYLSPEKIKQVRQLISQVTDEKERGLLYQKLQYKVCYENQRDSTAKQNGKYIEGKGGGLCNLTSLAMVLQYLGISNPYPNMQYEDALEHLRQQKNFKSREAQGWEQVAQELGANVTFLLGRGADKVLTKQWYEQNVLKEIKQGAGIIMSIKGHIVRLQDITELGLIVDDPYGRLNLGKRLKGGRRGGYEAYNKSRWGSGRKQNEGEDNLWLWADVQKYPMWWIASVVKK